MVEGVGVYMSCMTSTDIIISDIGTLSLHVVALCGPVADCWLEVWGLHLL